MRRNALRAAIKAACGAKPPIAYCGAPTIRPLDVQLEDAAWVKKAEESAAVMMLDVNKNVAAVTAAGSLAWASPAQADAYGGNDRVLLGRRTPDALPPSFLNPRYTKVAADQYCFATHVCSESNSTSLPSAVRGFVGLREFVGSGTNVAEAAMAGQARNLLLWHERSKFCGSCGSPTVFAKAGWRRQCNSCNAPLFPRTDPVIIVAVLSPDGERVLIGRQRAWPQGRYSCLAGFVDPGETLEEAVRREVKEEAGVNIGADVFYHSSQPWPNGPGGQLMCGFLAVAESEQLSVDTEEIETARWADIGEIAAALGAGTATSQVIANSAGPVSADDQVWGLMLPTPVAIAHSLLHAACEVHNDLCS